MKKLKIEWLAAALVLLVMGSVLIFLLISTLNPNSHEANITLPDSAQPDSTDDGQQRPSEPGDGTIPVTITRQNVQNVISKIRRPAEYCIKTENVVSYQDESRVTTVWQWVLEGKTVTKYLENPEGGALCAITQADETTMWYEGDDRVLKTGSSAFSAADRLAGIPTYENVLEKNIDDISAADYRTWNETACIYVEFKDNSLGYTERFYIGVENGVLVHAETYSNGEIVYQMTMLEFTTDTSGSEEIVPPS